MERITRFRAVIIMLVFCIIVGFFGFKLYSLQIIETGGSTDNTTTFTTYTRVKAARGDILDCNGNALVSNRASYDLVFNHYVILSSDSPNESLLQLLQLCQELEIEYIDHFPVTKERPFEYTLDEYSSQWQSYFQTYLANRSIDSDITAPLLMKRLRESYDIPEDWSDADARLVIGLRYELALRGLTNLANYIFIEDADDKDLSTILELNTPGLNVESSTVREYNTEYAAHILGFVGAMNADQWEYYQNIDGYEMDAVVGQDGLEKAFEEELHGIDGLREDVVTTDGTVVSSRYLTEPQAGNNVEVSIDLTLQRAGEDALASLLSALRDPEQNSSGDGADAEGGAVVAMEVKTGKVLVCASYPTYDLSRYFEDYEQIKSGDYNPLFNRALLATYPPGSTYKMSMTVAGIDSHTINSETTITDQGVYDEYDGFRAYCLAYTNYGGTHGTITAAEALQDSCNYFFYVLGDMLSINTMDNTAKGFGLGESTGIELYEEVGYRANEETKARFYTGSDAIWYKGDQILASIGQSDNRFTPLQLCVYACTLANQGTRYRATFLNRIVSSDYSSLIEESAPEIMSTMTISDEAYQTYLEGMKLVSRSGTAYQTFGYYPIDVAAKTGTAENHTGSDNAAFVCFAPADDPQIAIAVYGEKAGHGSAAAGVAKAILDVYFDVDEIGDVTVYENQIG